MQKRQDNGVNMGNFKIAYWACTAVFLITFIMLIVRHPGRDIWIIGTSNVMVALGLDFKNRSEHQVLMKRIKQLEEEKQVQP
ncbi:MAG: hypothetical protein A2Y07_04475 [Planctomycetes bacterium GWF2_50_10]|nr:MAG: hypothetical protein A2Y07_04475 [Planctomycetes bacterium GWF2_50_10]